MSVIAYLRIPAGSFELGRIMGVRADSQIELQSMVPLGEKAVPLFTVFNEDQEVFEETVRDHPSVERLQVMSSHNGETVYALDWNVGRDIFFQGILETGAHLLSAKGGAENWEFELRFPNHESLSDFQQYCSDGHIQLDVGRIYNPSRPGSGPWFGLTPGQKDTLVRAVQGGYYSIPRQISTQDLAEEFDISDQAVTERLRRAIAAIVENTLIATMEAQEYQAAE